MDTKEDIEIKEKEQKGHPQTDEGPYYHESWWEAYKGGVKGKLGGVVIGAVIGTVIGAAAAGVLAIASVGIAISTALAITAGFAAAGSMYGAHEFAEVGKVTGAVAAAHEKSEERMKAFENGKFSEIKKELSDLKSLITGNKVDVAQVTTPESAKADVLEKDYKNKHCDDHCPQENRKLVFWNIAAIGLAIGLGVGALLAFGGISDHLVHALGDAAKPLSKAGIYLASMTTAGLFGASFGINRDIFRSIFDKTDLLFKGIFFSSPEPAKAAELSKSIEKALEKPSEAVTTVVYNSYAEYPLSDTHHRDKVVASAKQALLSLDHTKSIPH